MVADIAKFCPKCGTTISEPKTSTKPENKTADKSSATSMTYAHAKHDNMNVARVIFVIVILVIIVAIITYYGTPPPLSKESAQIGNNVHIEGVPFDWTVLDVENGKALLITKDVVYVKAFDNTRAEEVTWADCTLREWCNGWFYNQLPKNMQRRISETYLINYENSDTTDKIFLLSKEEVDEYFESVSEERKRNVTQRYIDGAWTVPLFITEKNRSAETRQIEVTDNITYYPDAVAIQNIPQEWVEIRASGMATYDASYSYKRVKEYLNSQQGKKCDWLLRENIMVRSNFTFNDYGFFNNAAKWGSFDGVVDVSTSQDRVMYSTISGSNGVRPALWLEIE
jgi:hypothetical protein